jgi:exopolysaccharide biosynthesis predicted pyruvyltransferase EpsI
MKKIGILTLPLHNNYGGLLQAFALQKYLNGNGYEAVLIDRQWNRSAKDNMKSFIKKLLFKNRINSQKKIEEHTSYFINKYINKTKVLDSERKLLKLVKSLHLDAVVVGSDQVWRLEYTKKFSMNFFFDFLSNNSKIKKLSYAASFGEDTWNHDRHVTNKVSDLLSKFTAISVREDSSVNLCKTNFNVTVQHHIDPTMLLKIDDYKRLIKAENEPETQGDVLIYMLDINQDRQKTIDAVCSSLKGILFSVNVKSINPKGALQDRIYPSVTSWLKGFQDAKFVVTDSFHGSVFAILFNKPFIAYGNVGRGLSRFNSLFKMFGLEHRFIMKHDDLDLDLLKEQIDWEKVNTKLQNYRFLAEKYFKNNFNLS